MQQFKRVAAMLLCLVMLFSCLPLGVFAADSDSKVVDAAVIFSDLHTSQNDYKESTVKGVMTALKNTELPFSSVTSAGDAFSVNESYSMTNGEYTGYTGTLTGYIQNVLGDVPVNYVWTDHDRCAVQADNSTLLDKTSRLVYGAGADGIYGTADDGNYYVYVLSMADTGSWDRYSAGFYTASEITAHVAAFKTAAAALDKSKPLFIVAHQPLLDNRGDNGYAYQWALAINEVAAEMDVAYFFGHNHKYDVASDYYCAKGQTMSVATTEVLSGSGYSTDLKAVDVELNFTHMCAGYMSPGTTSDTTRQGVAVAVTIYEDAINYTTYDASGVYTGNYALNETVTRAFAAESGETVPDETEPEATEPGIEEELSNSVTIGGSQTYEEKTVYVRVDSFENGEKYLLIGEDAYSNGSPLALVNSNGSDISTSVTVNTAPITIDGVTYSEGYIELNNNNAVFTASGSSSNGYTLQNGSYYIGGTGATTLYNSSSSAVRVIYDSSAVRLRTASGTARYLYYSTYGSETWKWSASKDSTTSSRAMYIYKQVTAQVPVGAASVTYTMQASDLKHNLVGNANSAQLDYALLADGKEATALPTGGKYTFGIVGDNHDIIASIADDGTITFTGETGACRVKVGYTWTDGDQTYTVYKYVTVSVVTPNNYPEYPHEGAVKVNKTGTGIDFQSSGIAQVEISASGVPMSRGVDIIVMLDTSSSMDRCITCGKYVGRYSSKSAACGCNSKVTRIDELRTAMETLKSILANAPGADDIKIAVADFNGYYQDESFPNSPYEIDTGDRTEDMAGLTNTSHAKVFTGSGLNADAFVSPSALDIESYFPNRKTEISYSGTNYDYAFDAVYQLGHAIRTENEKNGEADRELFVLFMSDGAPNQYNYYHTTGGDNGSTDWNYWLTGMVGSGAGKQSMAETVYTNHSYYYDEATGNQHRMANAVKGNPNNTYEIIRKNQNISSSADAVTDILLPLESTDANYGQDNMYKIPGLGATMYSVAFYVTNDGKITEASAKHVLKNIPSTPEMYIEAAEEGALSKAFGDIATDILYAAYNARYVDQMGEDYNLQLKTSNYDVVVRDANGNPVDANGDGENDLEQKTLAPVIEVLEYPIYTLTEAEASDSDNITLDMVGDRKGAPTVLERVTFNAAGTEAYSDKDSVGPNGETIPAGSNILLGNVIYAKNFWYNTSTTDGVAIDGVSIPTGTAADGTTTGTTNVLPAETFYWKMGTVKTTELAMRYYVYLEGSMEGKRPEGSYPTNEYATLYYDNYLGNPCYKETVSPVLPWKEANVSYAFYLVNEDGEIIVNQTTGQTGSFANKIAVTNPVVYDTVLLNTNEEIDAVEAAKVLPDGYTLFDATYTDGVITDGATYTVTINSNTTGEWNIESVKNVDTTYVMHYDPNNAASYSKEKEVSEIGYDYTHTTVWFAVLWKVQALPDTVVVDYGLPVDISVLANDMFGENGKLTGIGAYTDSLNLNGHDDKLAAGFGTVYAGTYGNAKADAATGKVRYTLNDMQMNGYEKFAYAVNYTGNENAGYYYDTVTVIPATTIYYEDGFLTYGANGTEWKNEGTAVEGAVQAEDRPGRYSLTDANNIYGYDGVNLNMSQFSLGTAKKVHVDANSYATASFTFYGTGFDVISMTSNTTGTLAVKVTAAENITKADGSVIAEGTAVKSAMVSTYYGCNYEQLKDADGNPKTDEKGEPVYGWVPYPEVDKAMYQVPVMQIEELTYGKYNVTITATYAAALDKTGADGYDLYLDAIRIYDPANDGAEDEDTVIEDAYKADGEGWPSYVELRNAIIEAKTFANTDNIVKENGMVFIDGDPTVGDAQLEDYKSYGPNNEVYLASGQRVAFMLTDVKDANGKSIVAQVNIGIKSADGNPGSYTICNIAKASNAATGINLGQVYNEKSYEVSTTTDMYYDLTGWRNDIIVIENTGKSGIISLTNIKATYTADPSGAAVSGAGKMSNGFAIQPFGMTPTAADDAASSETAANEVQMYMTSTGATLTLRALNTVEEIPEETEPETEATEPETEATEPETTEPEETEPETKPENEIINIGSGKVIRIIKKLIGWIFG